MRGYTVSGSRELIEVGGEALAALPAFLRDGCEEDQAEVAEIRIYENMPIEVVIGTTYGFATYVWTRQGFVPKR